MYGESIGEKLADVVAMGENGPPVYTEHGGSSVLGNGVGPRGSN